MEALMETRRADVDLQIQLFKQIIWVFCLSLHDTKCGTIAILSYHPAFTAGAMSEEPNCARARDAV